MHNVFGPLMDEKQRCKLIEKTVMVDFSARAWLKCQLLSSVTIEVDFSSLQEYWD